MSEEEKEAKAQKKVEKEKNTQATQDALETGARAAATFFGGPVAGKLARIGTRLPPVRLLTKGAAKVANHVPGVATTTRRAQSSGALKAVDAVAGGSPKFKVGSGVKGATGSVLGGKSANNERDFSVDGGQQSSKSLKPGLDQNNSNQDKTTKTFRNKKNKKKTLIIIITIASLLFAGSVLISVIAEVASPIVKIVEFIEDIFDSDEDELTDDEKELIEDSYKEYLCGDKDDDDCIARYESFIESQEDFMERFKTVSKKYNLTKRQQVILYQTIIFGYPMEEIMPGEVYNIDKSTDDENVYEKENDTIETLAELFDGSEETYYNNLIEEDFFDDRKPCHNYYKEYADSNGLNPDNIDSWEPSDKHEVRKNIVKEIKSMSSEYLDSGKKQTTSELHVVSNNAYYWWPIGGEDKPLYTGISSSYGYRTNPITGEKQSFHNGIDIPAVINTPVIASQSGTVTATNNTCATSNSTGCGSGYGNRVEITDINGNINLYGHLAKDSIIVKVGDQVLQGQQIAGVGSSGNSTGPHLHFTIKINGQAVNPLDYVDPNNPRPKSSGRLNYNYSAYSSTEFATLLKNYYSRDKVCNSSSKQYVNGCNSFKSEILNNNGANILYEVASSYNINPELVVIRSMVEGYSPGTHYNYFGFTCYNTASIESCTKFSSFESSMNSFFKNLSQYTSLENMSEHYAGLGDYWYTQRSWGLGGCIYAEYIYPDGVPDRVKKICAYPEDFCTKYNTKNCFKTTDEDKAAFTAFQVRKMEEVAEKVFG